MANQNFRVRNGLEVGANVVANTSALLIGNSTVNSVLTSTSLDIDGVINVGNTTVTGDLVVTGNVFFNGTTTNVNSTNLVVEDKNIVLGDVDTPSDVTADGGGITLKGSTDKTLNWVDATDAWTSSEDFNLLTGKQYEINGAQVINSTSLGSGITGSSLTSVGTLASLTVTGLSSLNGGMNTTTANASVAMNVGANVNLTTSTVGVGNSTVNTSLSAASILINGSVVANSSAINVTQLVANGATGTQDQILYSNSTGGAYWRTPATITSVEPSDVGATSNGHVWYVYVP